MLSPDGFESMSGLAQKANELGLSREQFVSWVVTLKEFFLVDPDNLHQQPVRCDPVAIQFLGDDPVFFDSDTWVLSLDRLRIAASAYDERTTNDLRTGQFLLIPDEDDRFRHLSETELQFLSQLEGRFLVVEQVTADTLAIQAKPATTKHFSTTAETERAFAAWVAETPSSTDRQRNQWYQTHGLRRERGRELWSKLKPADGSKAGPKPKPQ